MRSESQQDFDLEQQSLCLPQKLHQVERLFPCFLTRRAVDKVVAQVSNRFEPNATNFWGAGPWRSIPKGLHLSAQGCEERATLGTRNNDPINPERVAAGSSWPSSAP